MNIFAGAKDAKLLPNAGAGETCDEEFGETNENPLDADESEPNAGAAPDDAGAPKLIPAADTGADDNGADEDDKEEEAGAGLKPNDDEANPLNAGAADADCGNEGENPANVDGKALSEGLAVLELDEDVDEDEDDDDTAALFAFFFSFEGALLESFESELVRLNANPVRLPPFMYTLHADAMD